MSAPEMLSDVRGTGRGPTAGYLGVIFRRAPLPAPSHCSRDLLPSACCLCHAEEHGSGQCDSAQESNTSTSSLNSTQTTFTA